MRLIDADALTKRLVEFCNKSCPYTAKARNVMCGSCFMGLALEAVEDAPTIKSDLKWIPCSVRLPEKEVVYIITVHYNDRIFITFNNFCSYKHGWKEWSNQEVLAWMPLPEPYREEK